MKATAKAHTNIALIKYWGKRNEELILPMNNSLSLTLDGFHTTTTVEFREDLGEDSFSLNSVESSGVELERVSEFLDLVRDQYDVGSLHAQVQSTNAVPTAAGFASSASGFAALAGAAALFCQNQAAPASTAMPSAAIAPYLVVNAISRSVPFVSAADFTAGPRCPCC